MKTAKPAAPKSAREAHAEMKARAASDKAEALALREEDRAEARAFGKTLSGLAARVDALEHLVKQSA